MESLFRGVYLQVPCVDTFLPRTQVKIKWDFTQEELERGKAMIAKAASTYVKGRMGGGRPRHSTGQVPRGAVSYTPQIGQIVERKHFTILCPNPLAPG